MTKRWTKDEIEYLKNNAFEKSHKEIALQLNRSHNAVRNKCYELGLTQDNSWTEDNIMLLRDFYEKAGEVAPLNLKKLEEILGRDKSNICRKAKQLGLPTNQRRKQTEEVKQKMGARSKEWIAINGHPKGMAGKTHSDEVKEKASERLKNLWRDPTSVFNNQEWRKSRAEKSAKNHKKPNHNTYSRTKSGKRPDLNNQFFRSSWEANFARWLNHFDVKWEYEIKTFEFHKIKRGTRFYTPDFWVPEDGCYYEVKGWMDQKSKTRLKRMEKYYPDVEIIIIGKDFFEFLKKENWCQWIQGWECGSCKRCDPWHIVSETPYSEHFKRGKRTKYFDDNKK